MSDNKRQIKLPEVNVGELVSETVRAHLHGGLPSSLIKRVKEGVEKYRIQVGLDTTEGRLASYLESELLLMYQHWKKREDEFYGA